MLLWLTLPLLSLLSFVKASDVECQLHRTSAKDGFHREVTTDVLLSSLPQAVTVDTCYLTLVESLPTGMYADLYQLQAEEEFGGAKTYSPVDMDIEKPEYMSPPHTLYIYGQPVHSTASHQLQWSVTVPVHLRYHRPRHGQDTATVTLRPPTVLISCSDTSTLKDVGHTVTAPCHDLPTKQCQWKELQCQQGEVLQFTVPVGHQEHQTLVVWGTLSVTVGATLYLCYVILRQDSNNTQNVNRGKKYK